ncbi:helix-turn-helix domain-containing protein [Thalassotalea agariperforans]
MKTIFDANYRKLIGWLIAERKFKNLTQSQVAEKLGYPHQSYISKIESFERKLDVAEYVKLCQVLDVNPHEGIDILLKPASRHF